MKLLFSSLFIHSAVGKITFIILSLLKQPLNTKYKTQMINCRPLISYTHNHSSWNIYLTCANQMSWRKGEPETGDIIYYSWMQCQNRKKKEEWLEEVSVENIGFRNLKGLSAIGCFFTEVRLEIAILKYNLWCCYSYFMGEVSGKYFNKNLDFLNL